MTNAQLHYTNRDKFLRPTHILAALPFLAFPALAEAEGLTPILLEFGTPRAQLWAILKETPQGGAAFAFSLADQLALNPDRKDFPFLAGTILSFSPLLKYDRNVNNGFKGDTIYIWGLPFEVDEGTRAVEATTVGGAVSSGVSFGVARGTTLTLSGRSEYQRAIGKEFEIFTSAAAVNLGYTAQNWTYMNAGFLLNEEKRALSDETTKIASFTAGKMLGEGHRYLHDVSVTFIRAEEKSTWQSRVRIDWTGTFSDAGMFKLGLERGREIDGVLLPRTTVTASYSNIMFGAPTTVSAFYSKKTGGQFFGAARNDNIYKIKAERKINQRVSAYLSYESKESTVSSFNEAGVDIGFNITGFRF